MKVNREKFLNVLEMVKAGLSPREFIEQSSCFVFQNGVVMTFNDEVACRMESGVDITGAVQAASLLAILEKIDDPDLKIRENEKGELEFRGKSKGFGITKDAEIFLPIDRVETPEKWRPLPKEFTEAIGHVHHCVSTDESKFLLTCVHVHPEYIEACDNLQMMRCSVNTGIKNSVLIRGTSIGHITSLGMDQVALTKSWIHFRNQAGLVLSCRRYRENYPSLDSIISSKGAPFVIPKGLAEASDRAAVFAEDKSGDALVHICLSQGKLRISGEGLSGWYKEVKSAAYDGPRLDFLISPGLLKLISERWSDAEISDEKLKISGGGWTYVTVLGRHKDGSSDAPEETKGEE